MTHLRDLRTLLDYHYWARDRVLDAAAALSPEQFTRDMGSSFKSVRDTLGPHLFRRVGLVLSAGRARRPTALPDSTQFPRRRDHSLPAGSDHERADARRFSTALGEEGMSRSFDYQILNGLAAQDCLLADAAARREPRQLPPRTGDDHAAAAWRAPAKSMDLIGFYRERA